MEIQDLVTQLREVVTGKVVFGEPYERDGVTIIPAARVQAGGGGGTGQGEGQTGSGGGGGLLATPIGAWVVRDGDVRWQPAVDVGRFLRAATVLGVLALLTIRVALKRRRRG